MITKQNLAVLAVTTTVIGLGANPVHALSFKFDGVRTDNDSFDLTLITDDTLQTLSYPAYTDPISGLTSPAYTFTGYLVTSVSGTYFEGNTANPIDGLLPVGSGVFNSINNDPPFSPDIIAHSPTDNLFNPNGGFAPGVLPLGNTAGKFSFGGLAFNVQEQNGLEAYHLFTRSDFGHSDGVGFDYAGCPGSCKGVKNVPEPVTILGSFVALGLGGVFKNKTTKRIINL
ncbi:PEP-CTERM sorting domain-containing protein [Geminocystis sp. NIES-3708]|uniref:PEP-CTERM sorting domain-containing protein n=1 Tax=Geminocystis sp. NIES-3708 TaxID=1615909 RepID=UPI0008324D2D|nr:PEP-CTERM sorting domain-containing protein [Geminocystis sp. NIES-3708]